MSAAMTETDGPIFAYRAKLAAGAIKGDPNQELAAEKLQALHARLRHYQPPSRNEGGGWLARLGLGRRKHEEEPPPNGLYIHGSVGRGKSMLMDLFFEGARVERKRRVHFHAFMQEVHADIFRWRNADPKTRGGGDDPIQPVAQAIFDQAWLLCFDEFQVTDVADAMILGRLFEALFNLGIVVVATSNRAPDDLYQGGINRQLFLPFIALFKEKLDLLHLDGPIDYRLGRLHGQPVWHVGTREETEPKLAAAFATLTDDAAGAPETLDINGRKLPVPRAAKGVAWFDFDGLCNVALGPADYLAIARSYHSVVLSGVRRLTPAQRDVAKRFTTLVDALYEARVKLFAAAEAPPETLYVEGDNSFEFERTVSRLMEMQSTDYMRLPHLT